jgi:hypothetical protein
MYCGRFENIKKKVVEESAAGAGASPILSGIGGSARGAASVAASSVGGTTLGMDLVVQQADQEDSASTTC